jgi:hypothetical protein
VRQFLFVLGFALFFSSALAQTRYSNCAALNRVYPQGVGRPGAVDKTSPNRSRVIGFTVNLAVYNRNRHLDRDGDGIACERRR